MTEEPAPPQDGDAAPEPPPAAEPEPAPAGPDVAELHAIEALYEAGDFREVHARSLALAAKTSDETVRGKARALDARVQLDPFVLYAWAGSVVVVAGIVYYYVIR